MPKDVTKIMLTRRLKSREIDARAARMLLWNTSGPRTIFTVFMRIGNQSIQ